jgi:hypothetical protein
MIDAVSSGSFPVAYINSQADRPPLQSQRVIDAVPLTAPTLPTAPFEQGAGLFRTSSPRETNQ